MSAPILITIPKYVPISPNTMLDHDERSATPSMQSSLIEDSGRGKKRRLDHLTWEERIQRKKLKNRVAAQTSRDRKKAKMDDMENTIRTLTQQTEILQNKCNSLQSINDSLLSKNEKLDEQVQQLQKKLEDLQNAQKQQNLSTIPGCDGFNSNTTFRSAEGLGNEVIPTRFQRQDSSSAESNCSLPALQDLLEDFDSSRLEELAESLLADITSDLEGNPSAGDKSFAPSTGCSERLSGPMVGTAAELMESSEDISSYIKSEPELDLVSTKSDDETLYGTYDEKTHSISIVLPGGDISINETVEEIVEDEEQDVNSDVTLPVEDDFDPVEEFLNVRETSRVEKSPQSDRSLIDHGYESVGSPQSDLGPYQIDDLWNDSFRELFPSLAY